MCILFYISFVCLHVCAYTLKFKVHSGSTFEPGASGLPLTPFVCGPNWRLCGDETTKTNGNLGDSEKKSNLNILKVCDTDFRKNISFPPIIPILSLVPFLKSSAISFGRKLHPIHGTEKMETSVTEKKSNLIKLKVCYKDLRKQIWFPPRVPILYGPFSQIQCDEFLSQITPHSLVTVPWLWSPSGLRCIVAVDVNKTKQKKSSPDPPP